MPPYLRPKGERHQQERHRASVTQRRQPHGNNARSASRAARRRGRCRRGPEPPLHPLRPSAQRGRTCCVPGRPPRHQHHRNGGGRKSQKGGGPPSTNHPSRCPSPGCPTTRGERCPAGLPRSGKTAPGPPLPSDCTQPRRAARPAPPLTLLRLGGHAARGAAPSACPSSGNGATPRLGTAPRWGWSRCRRDAGRERRQRAGTGRERRELLKGTCLEPPRCPPHGGSTEVPALVGASKGSPEEPPGKWRSPVGLWECLKAALGPQAAAPHRQSVREPLRSERSPRSFSPTITPTHAVTTLNRAPQYHICTFLERLQTW